MLSDSGITPISSTGYCQSSLRLRMKPVQSLLLSLVELNQRAVNRPSSRRANTLNEISADGFTRYAQFVTRLGTSRDG